MRISRTPRKPKDVHQEKMIGLSASIAREVILASVKRMIFGTPALSTVQK